MSDTTLADARIEAEAAQADLISAVGDLGSAAGLVKTEAAGTAKRYAPIALGIAGAVIAISLVRKLR